MRTVVGKIELLVVTSGPIFLFGGRAHLCIVHLGVVVGGAVLGGVRQPGSDLGRRCWIDRHRMDRCRLNRPTSYPRANSSSLRLDCPTSHP